LVLSAAELKRLDAVSEVQAKCDDVAKEYALERKALELKYHAKYSELYASRAAILKGTVDPASGEQSASDSKGIPGFWLTAMENKRRLCDFIEDHDVPALKSLTDICVKYFEDGNGYELIFTFSPNDYFTNETLTKSFHVPNVLTGNTHELEKIVGCDINWNAGKDLTVKTSTKQIKKGQGRKKSVVKSEPQPSFFRFFETCEIPTEEEAADMDEDEKFGLYEQMQAEADVGYMLKDKVIPNAVAWFKGEAEDDDDDDDEEDEEYDEEEEDEDGDEDDDDDEEDGNAPPRRRGGRRDQRVNGATLSAITEAFQRQVGTEDGQGAPPAECKQQ
jgi:nucleosome assembly protein 1-like 1